MSKSDLGSSFKEKLFDFIITKDKRLQNTDDLGSFPFGDWQVYHSSQTSLTTCVSEQGVEYYFLGTVFNLNQSFPRNSIGHYLGIEYNLNDKTLRLFRSCNSFLGVYYSVSQNSPIFFGCFSRAKNLVECIIDPQKVEIFFAEGIISDGGTLFKGIHQLGFQKQVLVKDGVVLEEREPVLKTDSPLNLSPAQFLEFTMDRFAQWFKHCPYNSLAISGGADSRLLLATVQIYPRDKIFSMHSRCHPQLSPEQDADVLVAKQAASVLQKNHLVQLSQGFPSAYLSQEPPALPPILSGLYGGELLGGELLQLVSQVRIQKKKESSFAEAISACSQMFLCDFYGGAWSFCSMHHNLTVTPYWDSYFIAALLQTPTSVIKEYSLLSKMYEHLPSNLRELPFVSILTDYQPQWNKPFPGVNAKSLRTTIERSSLPSSWLKHKKQLTDENYRLRAETLWSYLKGFYNLTDEELLSLL